MEPLEVYHTVYVVRKQCICGAIRGLSHCLCCREAMYLRSLQGFITAAGQVILNLYILSRYDFFLNHNQIAKSIKFINTYTTTLRKKYFIRCFDVLSKLFYVFTNLIQLFTAVRFIKLYRNPVYKYNWSR